MAKAKSPIPQGLHALTPQIVSDDAAKSIDWYKKALGAQERARALGPDGKIIHAELSIEGCVLFINDAMMGAKSPKGIGGSPVSFWIYVADCDALFNRAIKAGAQQAMGAMGALQDQFWGDRSGSITDPDGYQWTIATRKEDLSPKEMQERQDKWMAEWARKQGKQPAKK